MSSSPRQRAEAIDECVLWQAISRVYHPSILPLIEILEVASEQALYLVTDLIEYGVLSDAVFEMEMSEQSCRQIMIQLVSAVAHLHEVYRIAHLDIKPANVLCKLADPTMAGCLKLCDFGCSARFDSLAEPTSTVPVGTAHYFAPELAKAWLAYDLPNVASSERLRFAVAPLDCWALGVVCYQLLHGCPPFHNTARSKEVISQIQISMAPAAKDTEHSLTCMRWRPHVALIAWVCGLHTWQDIVLQIASTSDSNPIAFPEASFGGMAVGSLQTAPMSHKKPWRR